MIWTLILKTRVCQNADNDLIIIINMSLIFSKTITQYLELETFTSSFKLPADNCLPISYLPECESAFCQSLC